jgi:hypothetical protein
MNDFPFGPLTWGLKVDRENNEGIRAIDATSSTRYQSSSYQSSTKLTLE